MAESFTLLLANPSSEPVQGKLFENPNVSSSSTSTGDDSTIAFFEAQIFTPLPKPSLVPEYAVYIAYKNAFLLCGNSGTQLTTAFYFIDTGQFSAITNLGANTSFRTPLTAINGLVDNNGDTGTGGFIQINNPASPSTYSQILIRYDSLNTDAPLVEFIGNQEPATFAIPSVNFYFEGLNEVISLTKVASFFPNRFISYQNVSAAIGTGIRPFTVIGTGLGGGTFVQQLKDDQVNGRIMATTTATTTRHLIILDVATQAIVLNFGAANMENGDVIYVEHLNQYWLYASVDGNVTFNMYKFDGTTFAPLPTVLDFLGGSATPITRATMRYDRKYKRILFFGTGTDGIAVWDIDSDSLVSFNDNLTTGGGGIGGTTGSTFYDVQFGSFYPSGNYFNRLSGTVLPTAIYVIGLFNGTYPRTIIPVNVGEPDRPPTSAGWSQIRQPTAFDSDTELNYLISEGTGIFATSNILTVYTGADPTSSIVSNVEAGTQSYEDIVQQIQNQDVVITDVYINTSSVEQANKPFRVNFIDPSGFNYNEEYFPEISPFNAQIVVPSFPFQFISNGINDIDYEVLPNTEVEVIFTYEEFERLKSQSQFPDADRLNKLLGVGKYAIPKGGLDLKMPKTKSGKQQVNEIQIYNPLMNVVVQTSRKLGKKKIDLDKPHNIEIQNPFAKIIIKRKRS